MYLNRGQRSRPGREQTSREQLSLMGLRGGGESADHWTAEGATTEGVLATYSHASKKCYISNRR